MGNNKRLVAGVYSSQIQNLGLPPKLASGVANCVLHPNKTASSMEELTSTVRPEC